MSGSKPVLVTFENFKDREDILRKGNLLKGSNIHITEDLSKRTRESRNELRKYMRKVKRNNPSASCFLQYDKLYVDSKIYVFNDLQGKVLGRYRFFFNNQIKTNIVQVVEQSQMEDPLAMSLAAMMMSRPGSVMDDRPGSSMSNFGALVSPTKTPVRQRGVLRNSISLTNVNNLPSKSDWSFLRWPIFPNFSIISPSRYKAG